jgi:hypothetical protein
MVVPAFSALFADTAWQVFGNLSPLLGSFLLDKNEDKLIFLLTPWALDKTGV